MRSIKRQVQHGPTCRSILILVVGLCIISLASRPRSHYTYIRSRKAAEDDDLRKIMSFSPLRRKERLRRQTEDALVKQATEELGGGQRTVAEAQEAAEALANEQAEVERAAKLAESEEGNRELALKASGRGIHVMLTSNGSPYMNWQTRIMYYTYLQVADQPGSDFKYFTRVLHRSTEDPLMDDIPTVRVDPLDPTCDTWCEYPVASRPSAIQQWLDSGDVKSDWILMIETDYVFVKPMSIPTSGRAVGFPFGYISPTHSSVAPIMRKYYPDGRLEDIPGTGNAPVLAPVADLRRVIPIWVDITAKIEADANAKSVLGWVREMYSFSLATALAKMPIDLPPVPSAIMSQPPADAEIGDAAILHYTWGSVIKDDAGKQIWEFDKRKFTDRGMPDRVPEPPEDKASEAQKILIAKVNEAIDHVSKYTRKELEEMGKTAEEITEMMDEEKLRRSAAIDEAAERESTGSLSDPVADADTGAGSAEGVASDAEDDHGGRNSIHVMATSNGNPYMNWQTRLMYHSWKKVASQPGSDMKYFTRVLHRQKEDELMAEIPTLRVEPLDPKCDVWCDYPVASRPWAIQQWLESGDVKGNWIFMIETDYLFVKPVSVPMSGRALGFPFGYIIPTWPTIVDVMKRFYPGDLNDIPQTGNAPVLARTTDLRRVIPIWVDVTAKIEADSEAKDKLGWVREMYAFSIAAALAKMPIDLPLVPKAIMVQPPADGDLGDAAIIHYTWGSKFENDKKETLWEWDKRTWTAPGDLPPHITDPPAGMASELQLLMIKVLNEGIDDLWGRNKQH